MNDLSGIGLRERKRAQTSEALHIAAAELVLEHGLDATTIDAISDRADVSSRTFFNYYPSKEDAVLGIDEVAVAAELDQVRDYAGDPLVAMFDLIYAVFEASGGRHKTTALKREVMRKYPQLMTRQMIRVAELEDRLSEIATGWLAKDERFAADSEAERLEEARIILGICLATVRVSMKKWATESDADPGGRSSASADPRKSYERAITTLRTVLEKLP
jgi:AcrR family transcriptional regulator